MFEYLSDMDFLTQLDKLNIKVQYAKIILLSFDERPIKEIQGTITSGSLSVNGSSSVRRTISLSMLASQENSNIEDIDNEISIDKKVKVFIGYKNPFKSYQHYGDIVWFPCGLFILSSASISRSTSGWTISINGKDKMCMLDGTAGGTLPASTTFHEKWIELDNGDIEIQYPTIFQIIYEAVNHWGGEAIENIIITDIDEEAKMLVRYMGDKPIYFSDNYESLWFESQEGFPHMYTHGQDAGYKYTEFTYPGELVLNAGDTVVTLLDKLVSVLGNFEYFYTVDGKFVFQQIKNYLNTGSPLTELKPDDYVKSYNNAKFLYSLTDLDTTTTITRSPKYDNIKNDFYVWGKRKTASDVEIDIRYHLAIDTKPLIDMAGQNMWEIRDRETGLIIRYEFSTDEKYDIKLIDKAKVYAEAYENLDQAWREYQAIEDEAKKEAFDTSKYSTKWKDAEINWERFRDMKEREFREVVDEVIDDSYNVIETIKLIGIPCDEWREELYRRALNAQVTNSVYDNYYDSELIAEWRALYDPMNELWNEIEYQYGTDSDGNPIYKTANHWNPDVFQQPNNIRFWLDFIDTGSDLGKYSVNKIGRRTKVINSTDITSVYNSEVPDLVFIEGLDQELIAKYAGIGQRYFVLTGEYYDLFSISTTGVSCFDRIREMMYQNLNYNTTISLTCLPKYYIEPNNIIYIEDKASGIRGNYQITQFTLPLAYNGTMSITATEVLTRV